MKSLLGKFALAFVLFAFVSAQAHGQGMMMRGMGGMAGLSVVSTPAGQQELDLSEDQKEKLTELQQNLRSTMQERFQGVDFQNMTPEERQEKLQEVMKDVSSGVDKEVKEILNEEQYKRYKEISLQALGVDALTQEDVAKKLEITDEQKSKIGEISSEMQEETRTAITEAREAGDLQGLGPKIQEIREQGQEKALALLSDTQKATWKEMTGEPFKFEAIGGPGGGRRRPNN